jgi:putative ABC transport system permease protein
MRPYALFYFYRRRLRAHAVQELLAGVGVAIAVALVFTAAVAESSIAGSASEVVQTVVGPANLQLRSQDGGGFDERLLARVEHLPGVKRAAPLLEETANILAAHRARATVDLAGADISLAVLDGLAHTLPVATLTRGEIGLSRASARALGITVADARAGETVTLQLRGRSTRLRVSAVLGPEAVGALAGALVAVMPLEEMQRLAGLQGRITRVLVQSDAGAQATVREKLERLSAGALTVAPADQDVALLRQALGPSALASGLFAAIGALLGFLLAFNAMLLTVPERRRAIADLRIAGTKRKAVVAMVLFQALCLGLLASLLGLLAGYALALGVFHQSSGYLAQAFTLGGGTVVTAQAVLLSLGGGVLASCLASAIPLLDLRRGRARDAVYLEGGIPGNALSRRTQQRLFAVSVGLILVASALFALAPKTAIAAVAALALATVLAVPLVLAWLLRWAHLVAVRTNRLSVLSVALSSLRSTTLRSLALAATGAVALFGSVALGGSRQNLLEGIGEVAHNYAAAANIWVTSPADNQAVVEFLPDHHAASIAALPGVASVRVFQGSFFDLGGRRPWIIGLPPGSSPEILKGQMIDGRAAIALARLREGGWIVASAQIAAEQHASVGGTLSIGTPTGIAHPRIAATSTNFAWPTGVIFMSTSDYARLWANTTPTALGVDLTPGADAAAVQGAITRALGGGSALEVTSERARQRKIETSAGEALGQLRAISTLLLLAAILAMAAALGSAIWQRRVALAELRLAGVKPARLQLILLMESVLMLSAGCLTGALAGIYGQIVVDRYLEGVAGFPVASIAVGERPLEILVLVVAVTLAIVAIPGWYGARVSPTLALEAE